MFLVIITRIQSKLLKILQILLILLILSLLLPKLAIFVANSLDTSLNKDENPSGNPMKVEVMERVDGEREAAGYLDQIVLWLRDYYRKNK